MRKGIGHDVALRTALEIIVADHTRRTHCFFDVAGFDDVLDAISVTRPDTGEEIRLELEPDGELIVFSFTDTSARALHTISNAEQVLHMMPDFVRDDIGLREITWRPEPITQLPVEAQVDVNAPILRAIKRTAGSAGESAAGSDLVREEDQLRLLVLAARGSEQLIPRVFGIGQDNGHELRCFIARRVALDLLGRRQLSLLLGVNQRLRVAAEQEVNDYENDSTDSAAYGNPSTARAAHVLNVFTFPSSLPEHRSVDWRDSLVFTNRSSGSAPGRID
jgi:hypothetical protein